MSLLREARDLQSRAAHIAREEDDSLWWCVESIVGSLCDEIEYLEMRLDDD